jgi:hypothetical protein
MNNEEVKKNEKVPGDSAEIKVENGTVETTYNNGVDSLGLMTKKSVERNGDKPGDPEGVSAAKNEASEKAYHLQQDSIAQLNSVMSGAENNEFLGEVNINNPNILAIMKNVVSLRPDDGIVGSIIKAREVTENGRETELDISTDNSKFFVNKDGSIVVSQSNMSHEGGAREELKKKAAKAGMEVVG